MFPRKAVFIQLKPAKLHSFSKVAHHLTDNCLGQFVLCSNSHVCECVSSTHHSLLAESTHKTGFGFSNLRSFFHNLIFQQTTSTYNFQPPVLYISIKFSRKFQAPASSVSNRSNRGHVSSLSRRNSLRSRQALAQGSGCTRRRLLSAAQAELPDSSALGVHHQLPSWCTNQLPPDFVGEKKRAFEVRLCFWKLQKEKWVVKLIMFLKKWCDLRDVAYGWIRMCFRLW